MTEEVLTTKDLMDVFHLLITGKFVDEEDERLAKGLADQICEWCAKKLVEK